MSNTHYLAYSSGGLKLDNAKWNL